MSQEENLSKRLYDIINSIVPKLRIEGFLTQKVPVCKFLKVLIL